MDGRLTDSRPISIIRTITCPGGSSILIETGATDATIVGYFAECRKVTRLVRTCALPRAYNPREDAAVTSSVKVDPAAAAALALAVSPLPRGYRRQTERLGLSPYRIVLYRNVLCRTVPYMT